MIYQQRLSVKGSIHCILGRISLEQREGEDERVPRLQPGSS